MDREALVSFLETPPPRDIPAALLRVAKRGRLSSMLFWLGFAFLLFSVPFMWIFLPWNMFSTMKLNGGTPSEAVGKVLTSEKTSMSQGGSKHSQGTPIYRIFFTFKADDGVYYEGRCYRVGQGKREGTGVTVEYLAGDPGVARIKGCRLDPFGMWPLVILILPVVGGSMMFFGWRIRRRRIHLLTHGQLALARITAVTATHVRVNRSQQHKISVIFSDNGTDRSGFYKAYDEQVLLARKHMRENETIEILFDPVAPKRVLVADALLTA